MLFYCAALPSSRMTLDFVSGIIRRHASRSGRGGPGAEAPPGGPGPEEGRYAYGLEVTPAREEAQNATSTLSSRVLVAVFNRGPVSLERRRIVRAARWPVAAQV